MTCTLIYEAGTGRIVNRIAGMKHEFNVEHNTPFDCAAVEAPYDTDLRQAYILNGQVTERPPSPVALTNLTLQHLPMGGDLFIDGTRYEITDTTVELEFPLPGTFNLRVERFPYLDWTGSVTV
jgi:hypothetical protein